VIRANTTSATDTIKLKAKTYRLTIEGDSSPALMGDLNVVEDLKLVGKGPSKTVIDGDWAGDPDGLFRVTGSGTELNASKLALRDGDRGTTNGSGILVDPDARLKQTNALVVSNDNYGAVANGGRAVLRRVVFRRNEAPCCPAFYNQGAGVAKLTNVVFHRNVAEDDTGAMYSDGQRATLRNVTFSNNRAGDCCGGAIIFSGGVTNVTNVTFSGNRTRGEGGAIESESGSTANLNNVTITDNVADSDEDNGGDGGGIHLSGGVINMQNTLLAGNTDTGGEAPDCGQGSGDAFLSGGHNLIGDTTGCSFTAGNGDLMDIANLGLRPLGDNGGFTKTHALKSGSPAINKGSKKDPGSGGSACAKRDQRGVKRPQGNRCDIGAFERKH
jgi:predicted outer membrane repeat protein